MGPREVGAGQIGSDERAALERRRPETRADEEGFGEIEKVQHAVFKNGAGSRGPFELRLDEDGAGKIGRRQGSALEFRPREIRTLQVLAREVLAREAGVRQVRREVGVAGPPGGPLVRQEQCQVFWIRHRSYSTRSCYNCTR